MWKETIFALEVWGLLAGIVGICVLLAISLARPMPNGSRPKSSKELPCEVDTFERIDADTYSHSCRHDAIPQIDTQGAAVILHCVCPNQPKVMVHQ